jgi:hypothetical protein
VFKKFPLCPIIKCAEFQETCFKTETFELKPMAKCVEMQEMYFSLHCQEGHYNVFPQSGGPQKVIASPGQNYRAVT